METIERWYFLNCVAIIDGKHIVIIKRAISGSLYCKYTFFSTSSYWLLSTQKNKSGSCDLCGFCGSCLASGMRTYLSAIFGWFCKHVQSCITVCMFAFLIANRDFKYCFATKRILAFVSLCNSIATPTLIVRYISNYVTCFQSLSYKIRQTS